MSNMTEGEVDPDLILPNDYRNLPLKALRRTAREKIGRFLNLEGTVVVCLNDDGNEIDVSTNYNGLAELAGFDFLEIRNLERYRNPTIELLDSWTNTEWRNATVGCLWKYLQQMEREDVLKDCKRVIVNDCKVYTEYQQLQLDAEKYNIDPVQDPTVSRSDDMKIDETAIVAVDDVPNALVDNRERVTFDAFVCYSTEDPADRQFVRDMIEQIEYQRGLRLFVPGRNDLPGAAENNITAFLIEKRCRRVVILLSRAFLKSPVCDFQLKFAQCLAPGARSKRLIPVMREKGTQIPRILRFLAVCDFTKDDMVDWVWERLGAAIMAPIGPMISDNSVEFEESLKEVRYPTQESRDPSKQSRNCSNQSDPGQSYPIRRPAQKQQLTGSWDEGKSSVQSRVSAFEKRTTSYPGYSSYPGLTSHGHFSTASGTVLPSGSSDPRSIPAVPRDTYPRVHYSPQQQSQLIIERSSDEHLWMECSIEESNEHFV